MDEAGGRCAGVRACERTLRGVRSTLYISGARTKMRADDCPLRIYEPTCSVLLGKGGCLRDTYCR